MNDPVMVDGIEVEPVIEIVERIQTMHWDMCCCDCWICIAARAAGCRPRECYPTYKSDPVREYVDLPDYRAAPRPELLPPLHWRAESEAG